MKNEYPQVGGSATRWSTTPSCSTGWSATRGSCRSRVRPTCPDVVGEERRLDRADRDLPRPVLPRPAQRRLRPAARAASARCPVSSCARCRAPGEVVLLRRRRCPHVDGGEARHADQHQPHRGGHRHRRRPDRHRLPVLQGHDLATGSPRSSPRDEAEAVQVVDVAQMLLAAVRLETPGAPATVGARSLNNGSWSTWRRNVRHGAERHDAGRRQRGVAAVGGLHLEADPEQPHRPPLVEPAEQCHRRVGDLVQVDGRGGSAAEAVCVVNGAYRTFRPTRIAGRPSATMSSSTRAAQGADLLRDDVPVAQVGLERRLATVAAGDPRRAVTGDRSPPRAIRRYHGPIVGPSRGDQRLGVGQGQLRHRLDAQARPAWPRSCARRPRARRSGGGPMISYQVSAVIV